MVGLDWITGSFPDDNKPFLGIFETYPDPTIALWSSVENKYEVIIVIEEVDYNYHDRYFDLVLLDRDTLCKWMEIPEK